MQNYYEGNPQRAKIYLKPFFY